MSDRTQAGQPASLARAEVRTRFDLPAEPLTLADARLAVVNATLAACWGGEMALVRRRGVAAPEAAEQAALLRWLGIHWVDAECGEAESSPPPMGGKRREDTRLWQRAWEDQRLGISHAVVAEQADALVAASEHVAQRMGRRPTCYLAVGPAQFADDVPVDLAWYRERGFVPGGLRDLLAASTCWATPPAEPDAGELTARFRAGRLSQSPWHLDLKALRAAARYAMRQANPASVTELLRPRLIAAYSRWHRAEGTSHTPEGWLAILADAVRQESACLSEAAELAAFAFAGRVDTMTAEALASLQGDHVPAVLQECLARINPDGLETPGRAAAFFQVLRHHFRDMLGLRGRQVMFPIRAALAGSMIGPCLGIVASLLGSERCQDRLCAALETLHTNEGSRLG